MTAAKGRARVRECVCEGGGAVGQAGRLFCRSWESRTRPVPEARAEKKVTRNAASWVPDDFVKGGRRRVCGRRRKERENESGGGGGKKRPLLCQTTPVPASSDEARMGEEARDGLGWAKEGRKEEDRNEGGEELAPDRLQEDG